MQKNRKFVNPLTRPSTEEDVKDTSTSTLPSTYTDTSTLDEKPRKKKAQTFEQTHERLTVWVDKKVKQGFEELVEEQGISKSALLNEALSDLIGKYANLKTQL